ncbi:MAG: hypothetical protein ABI348_02480 [Nitrososphaera sp.]|jgi:hypothetical protein
MIGQFDRFCLRVLGCDGAVRSVRVADSVGRLVGSAYRAGLAHMKDDEEERYSLQSVLRAALRENFSSTNGRLRYSVSVYERLLRATVPLAAANEKLYLLLSLDSEADISVIMREKVIPVVESAVVSNKIN